MKGPINQNDRVLAPIKIDDTYLKNSIPSPEGQKTLTLSGAVEAATIQNRDIKGAMMQVDRFKWDHRAAETIRLPNIKALGYLAEQTLDQGHDSVVPKRRNAYVFLTAMVPITQQYRFGLEAGVIKLGQEIARERLREKRDEIRAKVKEAYYKLALDKSLLATIEDSIAYLNEFKKIVHNQVNDGKALKVDEMEVAARLLGAQVEQTKISNACNIDREQLNHLMGRPLNEATNLDAIPQADSAPINVQEAEQKALAMRPELRQAELRVRQLRLETKSILSQYIPDVSVGVVYLALPGFFNPVVPTQTLAPGILLNSTALDWGRKAMLAKARSKVEAEARLTSQSVRDQILIDLHKQINKYQESSQQLAAKQFARAATRERLRVSMNRYKYSAATFGDVLQTQSTLSDQNNSYHQALLSYWEAAAEMERATGGNQ